MDFTGMSPSEIVEWVAEGGRSNDDVVGAMHAIDAADRRLSPEQFAVMADAVQGLLSEVAAFSNRAQIKTDAAWAIGVEKQRAVAALAEIEADDDAPEKIKAKARQGIEDAKPVRAAAARR